MPSLFESFVNSEECKTNSFLQKTVATFESFVNSEECKTVLRSQSPRACLRALLIQKSVKRINS